jgi:hypothetical protein
MAAWWRQMLDELRHDTRKRQTSTVKAGSAAGGRYRPPRWKLLLYLGVPFAVSFCLMMWAILDKLIPPAGASTPGAAAVAYAYSLADYGDPTDVTNVDNYLCARNADRLRQQVVAFRQTIHDHSGGQLFKLDISGQTTTVDGDNATTTMRMRPMMWIPEQNVWAVGDYLSWTFTEVHAEGWQVCDVTGHSGCDYIDCTS